MHRRIADAANFAYGQSAADMARMTTFHISNQGETHVAGGEIGGGDKREIIITDKPHAAVMF